MPDRSARLVVVTPWYPTADAPYAGAFVRETSRALAAHFPEQLVVHVHRVDPGAGAVASREPTAEGDVLRVPFELPNDAPRGDVARATREALLPHVPELLDAAAVHVHVGMPTGWAVTELVADDVPVVVTEHASYLSRILKLPETRAMYVESAHRARALTVVSESSAVALRTVMPDLRNRVLAVPNPVDLRRFALRAPGPARCDRWLYVGNLLEVKGVLRLVRAFADWAGDHPAATLTLVGDGLDRDRVERSAADLGVAGRVRLLGSLPPEAVPEQYAAADILVHLSAGETFGLTALEAVASGLPVVATATQGARQVLDVAQELGMARLVPLQDDDGGTVRAALEDLLAAHGTARPADVRADLEHRFAAPVVGARLAALLTGGADAVRRPRFRAVVVSVQESDRGRARRTLTDVLRYGGAAVVVTEMPDEFTDLDPALEVVDVSSAVTLLPTGFLDRALLDVAPRAVLAALRRVGARGPADRLDRRRPGAVRRLRRALRRLGPRRTGSGVGVARSLLRRRRATLAGADLVVWGDEQARALVRRSGVVCPGAEVVADADHLTVVALARRAATGGADGD